MPYDYYSIENGPLSTRLDKAWEDYNNPSISEKKKTIALSFMIYVFDISRFSNQENSLNALLSELMSERESKKTENHHYIPIIKTGQYQLEKNTPLKATKRSKKSSVASVQEAFDSGKLLDVTPDEKKRDQHRQNLYQQGVYDIKNLYVQPEQRSLYNVEIFNGLFHMSGEIIDSSRCISHHKRGFMAFTLNVNGELSCFNHLASIETYVHSSMNAGAPLLAAGEMEIKNGRLININTYSGHYQPTLYSVARFLEYLSDRDVDTSQTTVTLCCNPNIDAALNLRVSTENYFNPVTRENEDIYVVPATDIVCNVSMILKSNIDSINSYLNSYKTKLKANFLKLDSTSAKVELGNRFLHDMTLVKEHIKNSSSIIETKATLELIERIVTAYLDEYNEIDANSGKLGASINKMKEEIQHVRNEIDKAGSIDEKTRDDVFKKCY